MTKTIFDRGPSLAAGRRRHGREALCLLIFALFAPAQASDRIGLALESTVLQEREQHHQVLADVLSRAAILSTPVSRESWEADAVGIRERLLSEVVLRGVPKQWLADSLRVETVGEVSTNCGYSIRKLRYEAVPGLWISALLYVPEGIQEPAPAVLQLVGHVGADGKAVDFEQQLSHRLAHRGYTVLSPDWPGYGELFHEDYAHNRLAHLNLVGTSGLSIFYLTARRAFDVLEAEETVDAKRIAVTGLSGGGWQTIILAALDTRVALAAPVAGFIGLGERVKIGNIGDLEQNATDLHQLADYTYLAALLAPRPTLLTYNTEDECCFPAPEAERSIVQTLRPFFQIYGALPQLGYHENLVPGTHNYEEDNQNAFLWFVEQHLPIAVSRPADMRCSVAEGMVEKETLKVGLPSSNATFRSLALGIAASPAGAQKEPTRQELREIVRYESVKLSGTELTKITTDGANASVSKLHGGGYSVASTILRPLASRDDGCRVVLLSDKGRAELKERALKLLSEGCEVLALDVLLHGTQRARQYDPSWYAQLLSTVGRRAVGIQSAQIVGAIEFYWPSAKAVRIESFGRRSSLAALVAAAIQPDLFQSATLHGLPAKLIKIVEEDVYYNDEPELFCFGLLNRFDAARLVALASPVLVEFLQSPSNPR